jgi:S-adenosylmethionine hydrolase
MRGFIMPVSIITLTTDFGAGSPYVAAMKGVVLSIAPMARIVDLSHQLPPRDIRHAAFFLLGAIPFFPPEALHVVVVDPGVGTERALLYIEVNGHRLLAPDNGCWSLLARDADAVVWRLNAPQYWRQPVSPTFHGRDILAPVAAHMSCGVAPEAIGERVHDWVRWEPPSPVRTAHQITGEVLFVDGFGNLITNIPAEWMRAATPRIRVGNHDVPCFVRTYGAAPPGTLVALTSSFGLLEIAIAQGDAATRFAVQVGAPVCVDV